MEQLQGLPAPHPLPFPCLLSFWSCLHHFQLGGKEKTSSLKWRDWAIQKMPLKMSGPEQTRCSVCEGLALPWLLCRWAEPWSVLDPVGDVWQEEEMEGGRFHFQPQEIQVTKKKPRSLLCIQQQQHLLLRGGMQVQMMWSIPLPWRCPWSLALAAGAPLSFQTPGTSPPASVGKGTSAVML